MYNNNISPKLHVIEAFKSGAENILPSLLSYYGNGRTHFQAPTRFTDADSKTADASIVSSITSHYHKALVYLCLK